MGAFPQLREIHELLTEHNIRYWVDSGTLLGLYRDEELIPNDVDMDFGLWLSDFKIFQTLFNAYFCENYSINIRYTDGIPYKIKLIPKKHFEYKILDFTFYIRNGSYAFAPQIVKKDQTNMFNVSVAYLYKLLIKLRFINDDVISPLLRINYDVLYWKIPNHFLTELEQKVNKFDFNFPYQTEDYLLFRYGKNWTRRDPEWSLKKDGGLIRADKDIESQIQQAYRDEYADLK